MEKYRKIGILTYHAAHNYGSMLQAFALQSFLERKDFVVQIINLRKPIQKKVYAKTLDIYHPKSFVYRLLKDPINNVRSQQKWTRFERFIQENLKVTKECLGEDDVRKFVSENNFYALIVGSDQIWNTACLDFDKSFLLPFVGDFKKLAYAPSMGPRSEFKDDSFEDIFRKCLPSFNAISTRETQSSQFLHEKFNLNVTTVLDPVLLLSENAYSSLYGKKPIIKGKYIFYYSPLCKKEYFEKALKLSSLTGLPIVVTQRQSYYRSCGGGDIILWMRPKGVSEYS